MSLDNSREARLPSRVAIFIPSLRGGGLERLMTRLAGGLVARNVTVELLLACREGENLAHLDSRVRVRELGGGRVLGALVGLVGYLRRERPPVLLTGMDNANLVALVARRLAGVSCRLVISVHGIMSLSLAGSPRRRDRVVLWLARRLYRWADAAVAVSADVARDVRRVTGMPPDRIEVIPNPVDLRTSREVRGDLPPSIAAWLDPGKDLVLAVGRLDHRKGFDVLIDAAPLVLSRRSAQFLILGEGPERPRLEEQIDRLQLGEAFLLPGYVDAPELLMARATILAVPSRVEGFGNVIVEALAQGTPVVVTDCPGGPREIVEDGCYGVVVPADDPQALGAALLETMARPPAPEVLRRRAADFALEKIVDRYCEVLARGD